MMHAFSGDRRVPLEEWQMRPFAQTSAALRSEWKPSRVDQLKRLKAQGVQTTEIARRMGISLNSAYCKLAALRAEQSA